MKYMISLALAVTLLGCKEERGYIKGEAEAKAAELFRGQATCFGEKEYDSAGWTCMHVVGNDHGSMV